MGLFSACQKKDKFSGENISNWNQVKSWSFKGKMAINTPSQSNSGSLKWHVNDTTTSAQLKALLSSWEITENLDITTLKSSQNGVSESADAQSLISNELGWDFPWNSLSYWLRGYREHQSITKHTDLPVSFLDNDWTITFQKWMATPLGMLPKKIKASKGQYSVKLIIYNWYIQ